MTLEALGVGELVEQEYIEREESLTQNPEEVPHGASPEPVEARLETGKALLEEKGGSPGECGVKEEVSKWKKWSTVLILLRSSLRGR